MQKYHFGNETRELPDGRIVRRIIAVRNFGLVTVGTRGGWIEDESNLSHEGECWISGNAVAAGYSRVTGNARIQQNGWLDEHAMASDDCIVGDNAWIFGSGFVYGRAIVGGSTFVNGAVSIYQDASVHCRRRRAEGSRLPNLTGLALVMGNARITGSVAISGQSRVIRAQPGQRRNITKVLIIVEFRKETEWYILGSLPFLEQVFLR